MTPMLPADDDLLDAIDDELADGPLSLSALAQVIARLFPMMAELEIEGEELELYIDELLFSVEGYWTRDRDLVALTSQLRRSSVWTVRLTAENLDGGWVDGQDLTLLTDLFIPRRVDGTGDYQLVFEDRAERFLGPAGWLDDATAGDLVAVRFDGSQLSHTFVTDADLVDSTAIVEFLRAECAVYADKGRGQQDFVLAIEACMVCWDTDPQPFRQPTAPVSELLVAAGFEQEGDEWGPADAPWETYGEIARDERVAELSDEFGFGPCCDTALARVIEAIDTLADTPDVETATLPNAELEDIAEALLHSTVAGVTVELFVRHIRLASALDRLGELLGSEELSKQARAGGAFIEAIGHEVHGDGTAHQAAASLATQLVTDFQPARELLGACLLDAGDLHGAIRLSTDPFDPNVGPATLMRRVRDELEARFAGVKRNDRCPCDSGRRFKQCCLRHPKRTPQDLAQHLMLILALASQRPHRRSAYDMAEIVADAGLMEHQLDPLDVVIEEGGLLADYVERRRDLLSDELLSLAESAIANGRTLHRVIEAHADGMVELEPVDGGTRRRFRLDRPVLIGDLLMGRFCEIDDALVVIGLAYRFDVDLETDAAEGLAAGMEVGDRLRWFDELLSKNPVRSANGERRVLITAVLEPADVAAFDAWLGPATVTDGAETWAVDPRADHDQPNPPSLQRADATHYLLLLPTESSRQRFVEDLDEAGLDVAWESEVAIPVTEGVLAEAAKDADL